MLSSPIVKHLLDFGDDYIVYYFFFQAWQSLFPLVNDVQKGQVLADWIYLNVECDSTDSGH